VCVVNLRVSNSAPLPALMDVKEVVARQAHPPCNTTCNTTQFHTLQQRERRNKCMHHFLHENKKRSYVHSLILAPLQIVAESLKASLRHLTRMGDECLPLNMPILQVIQRHVHLASCSDKHTITPSILTIIGILPCELWPYLLKMAST